ncbi:sulfotransferase [Streptomyces sp. NPDC059629]|uniref:sulfotransferase n=1 Tax=Streptomyces sp. NPDC059629 TaxID=3346889 RepID=UPI0036ABB37E
MRRSVSAQGRGGLSGRRDQEARFVLLLRHPGAVIQSLTSRRAEPDHDQIRGEVLGYAEKLEEARQQLPGAHVITYEDLTAGPEQLTRGLCEYLGVPWESGMLEYGTKDHATFRPKLGDWSDEIRSGRIQAARQADLGAELPPRLAEIAKAWRYPVQAPPRRSVAARSAGRTGTRSASEAGRSLGK